VTTDSRDALLEVEHQLLSIFYYCRCSKEKGFNPGSRSSFILVDSTYLCQICVPIAFRVQLTHSRDKCFQHTKVTIQPFRRPMLRFSELLCRDHPSIVIHFRLERNWFLEFWPKCNQVLIVTVRGTVLVHVVNS
jgi:hypothetical protein